MKEETIEEKLADILKAVNKATKTKGGSITLSDGKRKIKITNEGDLDENNKTKTE